MNKDTILNISKQIKGDVYWDDIHQVMYSTDASAYREKPELIVIPKDKADVKFLIESAEKYDFSLIPRTAGTSLAGQVVGKGVIVDCSKYMNKIIEVNPLEKWVRVEPGVVLDELNIRLKKHGLFFGPETSTSNRCMMGGMVGNNSCGAHSLIYRSTREHTLELKTILSDGSEAVFKKLTPAEYSSKLKLQSLEGKLYRQIHNTLINKNIQEQINSEFPDKDVERRNTGYAIDLLLDQHPFSDDSDFFNFCTLLCGSEGTLAFITEIKLNLVDLPPAEKGLLVVHHKTIAEALEANILALEHSPAAIELIDKFLLDCTKTSAEHSKNRFFIEGDPEALLCIEFTANSKKEILEKVERLKVSFSKKKYGFGFPLLFGKDISKVWALRKAGLGLLSNIPGDAKPQPVIEDTAISPKKLPAYIKEFNEVLKKNNLECVYYAHIATGELHLRPVINLKEEEGVKKFRIVAEEISRLVKKYGGSLSGEHGDGRLRGEFIPFMIGEENYQLLREIKNTWDPNGIFNPGKITDAPPMDKNLRFSPNKQTPNFSTVFDFSDTLGLVRMAEKCNGSADCRKSAVIGGTMCPSFQATKDEKSTTRARANMLREILNSNDTENKFNSKQLYDVLDLCLLCKGCKTECPSGVDMAKLKMEFLHQYYQSHSRPLRMRLISSFANIQKVASKAPLLYNYVIRHKYLSGIVKRAIGFAQKRSLPVVSKTTWHKWLLNNIDSLNNNISGTRKEVVIFVDEFTNYNEVHIGITMCKLLSKLGYKLYYYPHYESGRSKLSKGYLIEVRQLASKNVKLLASKVNAEIPLVGLEPSAILSFRDEYPDLLQHGEKQIAEELSKNTFTIEEFLHQEILKGNIKENQFSSEKKKIFYHGHCQQKALVGSDPAKKILSFPINFEVEEIKSGCCGMAGSFGYEKEHFDLSQKIGELVLFPKVRSAKSQEVISASGTSCRHHIKDGTKKIALHPIEILWQVVSI